MGEVCLVRQFLGNWNPRGTDQMLEYIPDANFEGSKVNIQGRGRHYWLGLISLNVTSHKLKKGSLPQEAFLLSFGKLSFSDNATVIAMSRANPAPKSCTKQNLQNHSEPVDTLMITRD
jgi:hypothetical protein